MPDSIASAQFCTELSARRSRIYFSFLLRIELAQALRNLVTRNQLPVDTRQRFQLDQWQTNVLIRQRWFVDGIRQFEALLGLFSEWYEIEADIRIWRRSLEIMALHQLRAHDAIHVATSLKAGVRDFATCGDHFRRVDELNLWLMRDASAPGT
jgi:predicted nucleic acid-binding protein